MDPKIVNAKVLKHTGNDLNIPCLGGRLENTSSFKSLKYSF